MTNDEKSAEEESSNSLRSLEEVINQKEDTASLEGKKIVWVEDDKFLKDIISRKLSKTKCILFNINNGEEALKIIDRELPDIVMLDIMLPGMDGFEVLRKIKYGSKTKEIPVILVSNLGQAEDIEKAQSLGADKFIIKAHFTLSEIIDQIKEVISGKK
jgi:two-component system alkaline phosphatase synthesis response regulator PhoP